VTPEGLAMRCLPSLFVALLAPCGTAPAAPAPFPRADRSQTWELTLDARSEGAPDAERYLRSAQLLWDLADAGPVRSALASRWPEVEDRERWLRRRVRVEVRGGLARVLVTAAAREARAVLDAVGAQLAGPPPAGARLELALARQQEALLLLQKMRRMRDYGPRHAVTDKDVEEVGYARVARSRVELAPLKVRRAARAVSGP
jgi:hypothetical protein